MVARARRLTKDTVNYVEYVLKKVRTGWVSFESAAQGLAERSGWTVMEARSYLRELIDE